MSLQSLFRQTAVYGISTIVIRFASWFLTPYYSRTIDKVSIGISAELMAIIAIVNIIYMIGMETSYFRFTKDHPTEKVFSTTITTVFTNSLFWTILFVVLATPIVNWMNYPGKEIYIYLLVSTAFMENLCNIPFARLRLENKPLKFLTIKAINVFLIIGFNVFLISYIYKRGINLFGFKIEDPVNCMFLANLLPWIVIFIYFSKEILSNIRFKERDFFIQMFQYSLPLIIVGIAGMTNEMIDRVLLKNLLPYSLEKNLEQVAIYNVNYKLAIIMALAIQAFRMGAEPYFFNHAKEKNSQKTYAVIMDFFIIACCMIMVVTNINRETVAGINESSYMAGIDILPVLLLAKLFLGVYYNASIWFKLTDNTKKGAWITLMGTIITISLNIILIPRFGFNGAPYATLACYFFMASLCIYWGQKYLPIPYHFSYNLTWIGISLLYSYLCFELFRHSIALLILSTILFMIVALYFVYRRWIFSKSVLAQDH